MDKILLISNDGDTVTMVSMALAKEPFGLVGVRSLDDARVALAREPIAAMVVDENVSGGTASDFLVEVARTHTHLPRMYLAAKTDLNVAISLVNQAHVYRILRKPWNIDELAVAIRSSLRKSSMNALTDRLINLSRRQANLVEELDREATAAGEPSPGSTLTSTQEVPAVSLPGGGADMDETDPVQMLSASEIQSLSRREKEILRAVVSGKKPRDLAGMFFISVHTARNHIKAIYRKLLVHSQGELIAKVLRAPGRERYRSVG